MTSLRRRLQAPHNTTTTIGKILTLTRLQRFGIPNKSLRYKGPKVENLGCSLCVALARIGAEVSAMRDENAGAKRKIS